MVKDQIAVDSGNRGRGKRHEADVDEPERETQRPRLKFGFPLAFGGSIEMTAGGKALQEVFMAAQ